MRCKRAYDSPEPGDGYRVLVDRLWPRGVRKEELAIAAWRKEIAPSHELRRRFHGHPELFSDFVKSYRKELEAPSARAVIDELASRARSGVVTLVYAARDPERNNAVVLRDVIERRRVAISGSPSRARGARAVT